MSETVSEIVSNTEKKTSMWDNCDKDTITWNNEKNHCTKWKNSIEEGISFGGPHHNADKNKHFGLDLAVTCGNTLEGYSFEHFPQKNIHILIITWFNKFNNKSIKYEYDITDLSNDDCFKLVQWLKEFQTKCDDGY
ncbi:MAG: hypothetical protein KIT69_05805 [Propionibacteriaceae bacterium]|nr:hypothetical protein [Propionibacteriaceae bacterium]